METETSKRGLGPGLGEGREGELYEQGEEERRSGPQHGAGGGDTGCPQAGGPELVPDVWLRVWDLLSFRDLAALAGVSREWRAAAAARTAAKRAEAAALVMAHDDVPDAHLTAAQWVFRAATRMLRGLDAFTGEPLDTDAPGWFGLLSREASKVDWRGRLRQEVWDRCRLIKFSSRCRHPAQAKYKHPTFYMCLGPLVAGVGFYRLGEPFRVRFECEPHTPEESAWLQGLLLALSQGSLANMRCTTKLPCLKGPLSRCVDLSISWWNSEDKLEVWTEFREFRPVRGIYRDVVDRWDNNIWPRWLENMWPPTKGECYLPLTLLKRASRPYKPHFIRLKRNVS